MKLRILLGTCVMLGLSACRPDTVELSYRFAPDRALHYILRAGAEASWEISGRAGRGTYDAVFEVTETVESVEDGKPVVAVVMDPLEIEEQGLPSPGLQRRSFRLRLTSEGTVEKVLEVDDIPAKVLDADELAFIGTYRPPLPEERVGMKDSWTAEQDLEVPTASQQATTTGLLDSLRRDRHGAMAELRYAGEGPLMWRTALPQGAAELAGSARTSIAAVLDIEDGFLRVAQSTTRGSFDVRVVPTDATAPLSGNLQFTLELGLEMRDS